MKFYSRILLFLLISCFCVACKSNQDNSKQRLFSNDEKPKVLSTIGMINDLVRQIGGDHIETLTLINGELDPHSYQLVKGDDEKLSRANIIFFNGLGLEHGPSLQRHLQQHRNAIALGDELQKQYPEQIIYYHGQLDPHVWMDVSLWAKTVPFIVKTLSAEDPAHADDYQKNGEKLQIEMNKSDAEIREMFKQVPDAKRYLVTSHDAFNYFGRAYLATDEERSSGLWHERVAAPEGLAPESQLSSKDIQIIIDHLEKYDIRVLFPESNISKDSIKKIISAGKEKGLKLDLATISLYADAMGGSGTDEDTYLKMILHNARVIKDTLIKTNHD
jgi:manganese/zinc/iron transport system substrate-binding protein